MSEIEKLRQRLKNVKKGVTEYRMRVSEAQALVREFDNLKIQQEKPQEVVVAEPVVITRTIDGGSF